MRHPLLLAAAIGLLSFSNPALAAKAPDTWDGLLKVKAKNFDVAYLLPQADFRGYTKVMIDRPEMAFRKNWARDQDRRIDDAKIRKVLDEASVTFGAILADAYRQAGYEVVTAPGPDVLRLSTAVINLSIDAPDQMSAGRSRSYSAEAGEGTLVVEARDSISGAVLGRIVDRRVAGSGGPYMRTQMSNEADFERLFRQWAKLSAGGLGELKARSPIDQNGRPGG